MKISSRPLLVLGLAFSVLPVVATSSQASSSAFVAGSAENSGISKFSEKDFVITPVSDLTSRARGVEQMFLQEARDRGYPVEEMLLVKGKKKDSKKVSGLVHRGVSIETVVLGEASRKVKTKIATTDEISAQGMGVSYRDLGDWEENSDAEAKGLGSATGNLDTRQGGVDYSTGVEWLIVDSKMKRTVKCNLWNLRPSYKAQKELPEDNAGLHYIEDCYRKGRSVEDNRVYVYTRKVFFDPANGAIYRGSPDVQVNLMEATVRTRSDRRAFRKGRIAYGPTAEDLIPENSCNKDGSLDLGAAVARGPVEISGSASISMGVSCDGGLRAGANRWTEDWYGKFTGRMLDDPIAHIPSAATVVAKSALARKQPIFANYWWMELEYCRSFLASSTGGSCKLDDHWVEKEWFKDKGWNAND